VGPEFLSKLGEVVGPQSLVTEPAGKWVYGYDNSRRHAEPAAVAFAASAEQVRRVAALCCQEGVSLVARGRGTGTTGGAVPIGGGVVLALERMNRILGTQADDRLMVVEPGVTNEEVQREAARHGFFWPPDPTSAAFCTIGGNLALNSAGPRAVKYGTVRENVLGLRAVTGAGEEIKTGVYTTKGVVGYDLTRLIVGSEGTLAVITEAVLKLTPLPEAKRTVRAIYSDVSAAARAVARIMARPVTPCALEFMDARAIDLVRLHGAADLPAHAGAMLMIEVDGPGACVDQAAGLVMEAATDEGLIEIAQARTQAQLDELWEARKALSPALRHVAPKKINEDVVVPVSRIPELMAGLEDLARRHAVTIVNFGHAGNGNIHVNLLVDPDDSAQMGRAERCLSDVFDLVLKLRGTLSGEHGVGIEKREFVQREIDPVTLALMGRIKAQFDPRGILNPGKLLPRQAAGAATASPDS
jgi:D-lactate dehydrogenase